MDGREMNGKVSEGNGYGLSDVLFWKVPGRTGESQHQ
jgi:hypothetical protein